MNEAPRRRVLEGQAIAGEGEEKGIDVCTRTQKTPIPHADDALRLGVVIQGDLDEEVEGL